MSFRTLLAATIGVAFGGLSVAQGALIVNDSFDTYANQAAFDVVWTPIGTAAPTSAVLSSTQSVSSPNSVQVPAESTTNGKNRNRQSFSETSTLSSSGNLGIGDQLTWSFDSYDSNSAAAPYRQFSNLQDSTAPTATNQLVAMGLNNNQSSTN